MRERIGAAGRQENIKHGVDDMSDKQKAVEEKLDARMREWNVQIALLKTNAENAKAGALIEFHTKIDTLRHKHELPVQN